MSYYSWLDRERRREREGMKMFHGEFRSRRGVRWREPHEPPLHGSVYAWYGHGLHGMRIYRQRQLA